MMIHSGSANGGHYYAYIRSYEDNKWYSFNDDSVTEIPEAQLSGVFGEEKKYQSQSYTSSTNAYMFVYRKVDEARNSKFQTFDELPAHLKELVKYEKSTKHSRIGHTNPLDFNNLHNQTSSSVAYSIPNAPSTHRQNAKINVYVTMSISNPSSVATSITDANNDAVEKKLLVVASDATVSDVLERMYTKFKISQDVDFHRMRLVEFDSTRKMANASLGEAAQIEILSDEEFLSVEELMVSHKELVGEQDFEQFEKIQYWNDFNNGISYFGDPGSISSKVLEKEIGEVFPESCLGFSKNNNLLLQIKDNGERFSRYRPGEICLKCYMAKFDEDSFGHSRIIRMSPDASLERVSQEISRLFGVNRYQLSAKMVNEGSQTPIQILPPRDATRWFFFGNVVFCARIHFLGQKGAFEVILRPQLGPKSHSRTF